MPVKLVKLFNDLRASYWFIPFCMLICAILLAVLMRWLDGAQLATALPLLPWIKASGTEEARAILTVIASGVLGVAGVTFSITIVAVSFASSNFGPRLIGNFMRDRGSQITLGTFIGTFVYCLLILSNVHGKAKISGASNIEAFIPYFSIILALVLMLASICVLIYFIHHIAETLNIENIIAAIGLKLQRRINDVYPGPDPAEELLESPFENLIRGKPQYDVTVDRIGYVQAIDHEKLACLATDNHLLISVHYRPGDFVSTHDCLMSIWSESNPEDLYDDLRECLASGQQRTEHQNVLFLVEQLAEVIARALSPGVNDPYTAISCLNWYKTALAEYVVNAAADNDESHWHRRRIQLLPVSFDRLTAVMFDSTRPYISSDNNVVMHTLAILCECACLASPGDSRDTLIGHLEKTHRAAVEHAGQGMEAEAITARYSMALHIVQEDRHPGLEQQGIDWFGGSA